MGAGEKGRVGSGGAKGPSREECLVSFCSDHSGWMDCSVCCSADGMTEYTIRVRGLSSTDSVMVAARMRAHSQRSRTVGLDIPDRQTRTTFSQENVSRR